MQPSALTPENSAVADTGPYGPLFSELRAETGNGRVIVREGNFINAFQTPQFGAAVESAGETLETHRGSSPDDPALGGIRNAPPGASNQSSVIAVQLSRQHVVDLLRQANLTEMSEAALHDLPDPVDREDVAAWGGRWNIDMDYFIDRMGGSP